MVLGLFTLARIVIVLSKQEVVLVKLWKDHAIVLFNLLCILSSSYRIKIKIHNHISCSVIHTPGRPGLRVVGLKANAFT